MENGEGGIIITRNAKSLMTLEVLKLLPSSGLQKMLIHDLIIAQFISIDKNENL